MQRTPRAATRFVFLVCGLACLVSAHALAAQTSKTNAQIKEAMIRASIAAYTGSCPCPFNVDRGGRRCGKRSAYHRPGGKSPLCFPEDITSKMIEEYRRKAR